MPRQGQRLGTPEVWNVCFCQGLICGSCQEQLGPQPYLGPLPAICFYQCPRLPFASRQNRQNPPRRRLLPWATLATAIPWATASHVFLPASKTAVCQPSKPPTPPRRRLLPWAILATAIPWATARHLFSAASFATPGDSGHSHTLGHCQTSVFTGVQFASRQNPKTLRGVVCYPGRLWPQPYTWATASHRFLPVSKIAVCQPSKPPKLSAAASFAPPGDSGHSHTLGHCQPCVFTRVQDCRLPAVKTLKQLPHSQAPLFKWGSAAPGR